MTSSSALDELHWPAKRIRAFDIFRSDRPSAKGPWTPATLAHRFDRPLVRYTGQSLMTYLFQPRALDGRRLEPPVLLTTVGWKSGMPRSTVVSAFGLGGGWLVIGSNGGGKSDPAWVKNLRAHELGWVVFRRRRFAVKAALLDGDQYDEAYRELEVRHPVLSRSYSAKAGAHERSLTIWLLTPVAGGR